VAVGVICWYMVVLLCIGGNKGGWGFQPFGSIWIEKCFCFCWVSTSLHRRYLGVLLKSLV